MTIIEEALVVRNDLKLNSDYDINPIDENSNIVPMFKGNKNTKLIIVGQDPTIKNVESREEINCTLNLDRNNALRTYVIRICCCLGISLDSVYATNLFKYFYTFPPNNTSQVLIEHSPENLELLKKELRFLDENIPIITFGELFFQLLTKRKDTIRDYWGYDMPNNPSNGNYKFLSREKEDNNFIRNLYPFPHQPTVFKIKFYRDTIEGYLSFIKNNECFL